MADRTAARASTRVAAVLRDRLAEDLRRLCGDAGVAQPALSRVSGVSQGYISEILAGSARPSIETYARLAAAVGADLSMRLYPNTGPAIHDRHQARILEGLLARIHPRWRPTTEVAVRQPARGWVDLVLAEPRERIVVATEIESGLRRLEQMIRWSREKADSLPSWPAWAELGREATISQLLIVRRTRANRDVARSFAGQLAIAYPAHPDDAIVALTGTARWPGAALVWVQLERDGIRLVPGR